MLKASSFRWQIVPATLCAFAGAVTLPGPLLGLFYVLTDIILLHNHDWYLESRQTKALLVFLSLLPIGSALVLIAARAWWRSQNARALLLTLVGIVVFFSGCALYGLCVR